MERVGREEDTQRKKWLQEDKRDIDEMGTIDLKKLSKDQNK